MGHDPAVESGAVTVNTAVGVVELTGKVSTLLAKERATRHAEVIKGVRAVSNRLQVDATKVPDDALAENVHATLLLDPAADSYEIRTKAKQGVVTLEGKVQSGLDIQ